MTTRLRNNQSGLTLLELVIVVSLFSAMILSVSRVFTKTTDIQRRSMNEHDLQSNIKYGLGVLMLESQEIMRHVDNCGCGDCGMLANKYYGVSADEHKLYLRHEDNVCVVYSWDDIAQTLMVEREGSAPIKLSSDDIEVNNVRFVVNNNKDRFTMMLSGIIQDKVEQSVDYQISITASDYENES